MFKQNQGVGPRLFNSSQVLREWLGRKLCTLCLRPLQETAWNSMKRHQRISKKPYWTYLLNTLHGQLRLQSHRPLHAWCMCELDQVMRKSETRLRWIFRCRKSRSFANFYFNRKVSMGTTPPTHTQRREGKEAKFSMPKFINHQHQNGQLQRKLQ